MIRPAVRRAVAATRNRHVGVISTVATHTSRAYEDAFAAAPHLQVTTAACPRFVELVERGVTSGPEVLRIAHDYLDPIADAGVDTLILGCTHYPLLTGAISYVMGDRVTLVSSADETAKDVYRMLVAHDLVRDPALPPPRHRFLTTGDPANSGACPGGSWDPRSPRCTAPPPWRGSRETHRDRCSGSFPGPDGPASCYLVEAPYAGGTFRLLLDLGNGSLGPLQRHAPLDGIDAVVISHLHPDHCLDLCSFYVARRYPPAGPLARIPVHGPAGTADRMARAYDLDPDPGCTPRFAFRRDLEPGPSLGPFTVRTVRVNHPVEAYAVRVEHGGRSLVLFRRYRPIRCVDVARPRRRPAAVRGVLPRGRDTAPDLHLNGREAAEHATRAGASRLVLTHLPPWNDAAQPRGGRARRIPGRWTSRAPGVVLDRVVGRTSLPSVAIMTTRPVPTGPTTGGRPMSCGR